MMKQYIRSKLLKFPILKTFLKKIIISVGYITYLLSSKSPPKNFNIVSKNYYEAFMGYYGSIPCKNNLSLITAKKNKADNLSLYLTDFKTINRLITDSPAWTYQQGCRSLWINDNEFVYNQTTENGVCAMLYSTETGRTSKISNLAVLEARNDLIILGYYNNYRGIADEYYPGDSQIDNKDVLMQVFDNRTKKVIWSIKKSEHFTIFQGLKGIIIHPLISPCGKKIQFIYRAVNGLVRTDRFLIGEVISKKIKILFDDGIFSHFSWIDSSNMIGYFEINGEIGYWKINLEKNRSSKLGFKNIDNFGDGHPVIQKNSLVIDTYPNVLRIQKLIILDINNGKQKDIFRFASPPKFSYSNRCDLHPRISEGGEIFVDTIYKNNRHVAILSNYE